MDEYVKIALEIDGGMDANDAEQIKCSVREIDRLLAGDASSNPILYYYRANAFSNLRKLSPNLHEEQFGWQQPEFSEEILSLRRAVKCPGFEALSTIRRCQIWTNLGDALSYVGRPVEAIAAWDKALAGEQKFAMAAANRALGLAQYSAAFYDKSHQCIFLREAALGFRAALSSDAVWDSIYPDVVKDGFQSKLSQIETYLARNCDLIGFDPFDFELGADHDACALNQWRLDNRLFLNPLNDLGRWPVAATDVFHLPSHSYDFSEEPRFPKYYDLIKQEYVAACVLLYEGVDRDRVHPADSTLLTFEHADYSVTSVEIEKQKAAFRLAYSLFDKCAAFINDYFSLGHDPKSLKTTFRRVWLNKSEKCLNENLPPKNWRLRGLYSLSLDLFDAELKEIASPLALKADAVRNAIEHRFVSVYENPGVSQPSEYFENISTTELFELSLHMLKLARATIMGLSLAMQHQETHLKAKSAEDRRIEIPGVPKMRP